MMVGYRLFSLVPSWRLTNEMIHDIRAKSSMSAMSRFMLENRVVNMSDTVVRDLLPSDLSLPSWETPDIVGSGVWFSSKVCSRSIVIYGLVVISEDREIDGLRFNCPGWPVVLSKVDLTRLYGIVPLLNRMSYVSPDTTFGDLRNISMEGYFISPMLWGSSGVIEATAYGRGKSEIVLLGYVAEHA